MALYTNRAQLCSPLSFPLHPFSSFRENHRRVSDCSTGSANHEESTSEEAPRSVPLSWFHDQRDSRLCSSCRSSSRLSLTRESRRIDHVTGSYFRSYLSFTHALRGTKSFERYKNIDSRPTFRSRLTLFSFCLFSSRRRPKSFQIDLPVGRETGRTLNRYTFVLSLCLRGL